MSSLLNIIGVILGSNSIENNGNLFSKNKIHFLKKKEDGKYYLGDVAVDALEVGEELSVEHPRGADYQVYSVMSKMRALRKGGVWPNAVYVAEDAYYPISEVHGTTLFQPMNFLQF